MSWRVVAASAVGTSHEGQGGGCEDTCWAQVEVTRDAQEILSIFVCDGAGSAARGREGADVAIEAAVAFLRARIDSGESAVSADFAAGCLRAIRERISATAAADALPTRAYACTLVGVVSSPTGSVVLQLGDGGVVIDTGEELQVPVAPMTGEYANMTHFVTDEDAEEVMAVKTFLSPALRVAVFSDGLQRLALNLSDNTPHEPFFLPFFKVLQTAPAEQQDQLQTALLRFLSSPAVNERTDDDKTLAVAVLTA